MCRAFERFLSNAAFADFRSINPLSKVRRLVVTLTFFCARPANADVVHFVRYLKVIMSLHSFRWLLTVSLIACFAAGARASDDPLFHSQDTLAPRDEWGVFHQTKDVNPVDYAHRYPYRIYYYFHSGKELLADPAYVGALQVSLRNRGYYCGPIDGIMSEGVSFAIAQLQKNHTQAVTGTLTVPVRRVLHLP